MNIQEFAGRKWKDAVGFFADKDRHFLACLCGDKPLMDAAVLARDHGPVAGTVYVAAVLYHQKHGGLGAVLRATAMWEAVKPKVKDQQTRQAIQSLSEWVAWAGSVNVIPYCNQDWPLAVPKKVWTNHGGLMNFMLGLGIRDISEDGITTHLVAANGVADFLSYMAGRKKVKRLHRR